MGSANEPKKCNCHLWAGLIVVIILILLARMFLMSERAVDPHICLQVPEAPGCNAVLGLSERMTGYATPRAAYAGVTQPFLTQNEHMSGVNKYLAGTHNEGMSGVNKYLAGTHNEGMSGVNKYLAGTHNEGMSGVNKYLAGTHNEGMKSGLKDYISATHAEEHLNSSLNNYLAATHM